eukprot:scaffold32730_cov36-Cyclotella_meneghiniana.AAC.2
MAESKWPNGQELSHRSHVEEARQSARAKIHCIYYCDFNAWANQFVREEDGLYILEALQDKRPSRAI